ncbi:MAG: hypothetical protein ABWY56_06225 [Propionibacteriaceae bacterium]
MRALTPRRRAWCWTACAALLVLIYLTVWTVYSAAHLGSYPRYVQLDPGVAARQFQADFRLLSLVQTEELTAGSGDPQIAAAGAVWVVAELEVTQRAEDSDFVCSVQLLGPNDRAWEHVTPEVSRPGNIFCSDDDLQVGQPYRFEQVFEVPASDADQLRGVVVVQRRNTDALQVLTPPS